MNAPAPASGFDLAQPRHDWTLEEVEALFETPLTELVFFAEEPVGALAYLEESLGTP